MGAGWEELALLAVALALDLAVGEPPAWAHPTVWMGRLAGALERRAPRRGAPALLCGALIALLLPAFWAAAAFGAMLGLQALHPLAYVLGGGALLKTTFAVRMLHREAGKVRRQLEAGNLAGARAQLPALVSRDPSQLTAEQTAAATVESVSENISDSFLGPWLAFALFGLPGAFAYRAVNTLDSMIGYRGEYEYLGKAAARLDDAVNLLPARLAGLLLVAASAVLPQQRAGRAWRIMRRDHARTPSPNAGWTMSGMAGALGVRLEKIAPIGGYQLGDPARPLEPQDIARAVQSMYAVAALGLAAAAAILTARHLLL